MVLETTSIATSSDFYDQHGIKTLDAIFGIVFIVCIGTALFGNITIMLLLIKNRQYIRINALIVLAVTLGISDVMMVIFSGIPNVVSLLQFRSPPPGPICGLSGWIMNFNNRMNSFITTCICLVRCAVVVWPIHARILLNNRALLFMVASCAVTAIIYSSLPYVLYHYAKDAVTLYVYYEPVGFCMYFLDGNLNKNIKIASTFLTEMVLFIPFLVSIVTCSMLLYTLKKKSDYVTVDPSSKHGKSDNKSCAIWGILRLTMLTLICYTPMLLFTVYNKLQQTYKIHWFNVQTTVYLIYMVGFQLMFYLRASINPFIINMHKYLKKAIDLKKNASKSKGTSKTREDIIRVRFDTTRVREDTMVTEIPYYANNGSKASSPTTG